MENEDEKKKFLDMAAKVKLWIGHNICGYDLPVLEKLLGLSIPISLDHCIDTLIVSRMVDYSRPHGHSVESYGEQFGIEKSKFSDWTKWSQELEDRCVRDVDISNQIYNHLRPIITDPVWRNSLETEHCFQQIVNQLHNNGFCFNHVKATGLLDRVTAELLELDTEISREFPPKLKLVREVTPTLTKHGTLNKKDFRWVKDGDLSDYNGYPFSKCVWSEFNPSSHKQIIEVLHQAGWKPVDKTKTHIETERELNRSNRLDLTDLSAKMVELSKFGWRVNENNLQTLPVTAPKPARTLAKRILLEARRRTLTEWLELVGTDGRIRGKFYGIGAWTHRMAHQNPNTANIPTEAKLFGKEMRSLWIAPKKRLLVGVDAEGIQLRIFAHYINDTEFTEAIVNGRKDNNTDPHSLNANILGCTRDQAKRFLYAYLLGGGVSKLSEVLGRNRQEGQQAVDTFIKRYSGLSFLKRKVIPTDAERGYFIGLDGRRVPIPGVAVGDRRHLCMSGYLQNGEAIIIKLAAIKARPLIEQLGAEFVDIVHDEYVIESPNNVAVAEEIKAIVCRCIADVGSELKLNCPMKGDGKIGNTWFAIH